MRNRQQGWSVFCGPGEEGGEGGGAAGAAGADGDKSPAGKTLTQAEVDSIVKGRIADVSKKSAAERADLESKLAAIQAERDELAASKLTGEERTKAEAARERKAIEDKAKAVAAELEKERADRQAEREVLAAERDTHKTAAEKLAAERAQDRATAQQQTLEADITQALNDGNVMSGSVRAARLLMLADAKVTRDNKTGAITSVKLPDGTEHKDAKAATAAFLLTAEAKQFLPGPTGGSGGNNGRGGAGDGKKPLHEQDTKSLFAAVKPAPTT